MAHELSIADDGTAEAIYTGSPDSVWHRLGRYVAEITKDALRKVVGIPLEMVAYTFERPLGNGDAVATRSKQARAVVRTDTGRELAAVGMAYELIPHDFALLDVVEPILDSGLATVDAAGLLFGGAGAWSLLKWDLARFDSVIRDVYRDEIQVYGLCQSWVNGKGKLSWRPVTTRTVCHNTLQIGNAEGARQAESVSHRKNARSRSVSAVESVFEHVIAQHRQQALEFQALKRTYLDKELWRTLVGKVALPTDPSTEPGFDANDARDMGRADRWRDKGNGIYRLWAGGKGHTGDRSAWEAYNGLVESMDHDADAWRARSVENKVVSLTSGPMAATRDAVYSGLLDHCRKVGTLVS